MRLRQGILLTVASLVFASAAIAQTKSPTAQNTAATTAKAATFKDLDKNSDGYINKTEAASSTGLVAMFPDLDANKDGKLSSQEYAKRAQHN
jgi:ABC-type transporter MlaC component